MTPVELATALGFMPHEYALKWPWSTTPTRKAVKEALDALNNAPGAGE